MIVHKDKFKYFSIKLFCKSLAFLQEINPIFIVIKNHLFIIPSYIAVYIPLLNPSVVPVFHFYYNLVYAKIYADNYLFNNKLNLYLILNKIYLMLKKM